MTFVEYLQKCKYFYVQKRESFTNCFSHNCGKIFAQTHWHFIMGLGFLSGSKLKEIEDS